MGNEDFDVIVIGAGPGGEVAAIRARQLGLRVALVERRVHLGGTCLNVGCIPTKALIESARMLHKIQHVDQYGIDVFEFACNWQKILDRKQKIVNTQRKGLQYLMKKNEVELFVGWGKIINHHEVEITHEEIEPKVIKGKHILIATGSKVTTPPFASFDGKYIHSSDTILDIKEIPKTLAVIGGGVVGMEFASLFSVFGTEVTVIELLPQILPTEDHECVRDLERYLKKRKIKIETNTKVSSITVDKGDCVLSCEDKKDRKFSAVLLSIGRTPVIDRLGLDECKVFVQDGFVKVNQHYQTNIPNIFAVGDVIATPALAHTASAEAMHAVEVIAGHSPSPINYENNPSAIYTLPEIASIGHTEIQLREKSIDYKIAKFPFSPLAKAKIENIEEGFVKILYDPKYKDLLGVHIIGAKATELIAEFVLGKSLEVTIDEIAHAIHPHPTISETIMEAAHVGIGGAIHL